MNSRRLSHEGRAACLFLRWIVPSIVILLAVAVSADPVESESTTSTGVNVTLRVPFVRESIDEIFARAPLRTRAVSGDKAIPFHRIPRRPGAGLEDGPLSAWRSPAAPAVPSSSVPSAPLLDISFAGLGNPPAGQDVIPPDTMGAAGPNHLVSLLNSDFGVFDKAGHLLQTIDLQAFWSSLGTGTGHPANFPFDTKILYDQYSGRFVAITLGGTSSPNSWILVAVSATSDPTGAWSKWAIDADVDNNVQSSNWADFPGFGLDSNYLYICANMFDSTDSFQYSKVWVLPKPQLLSGTSSITWTEFRSPPGSDFNMQPAHTFGIAPAEYFLYEGAANRLNMAWIDSSSGTPVWHAPVSVPIAAYVSSNALPGAPQSGSANTIDTSDTRILNVVYRAGALWAAHTVQSPAVVKTEVAWHQINPGTGTVLAEGRISDPVRWYYYPSIAVNKDNVVAVGFSGSSTTEFAGGYYTIIQPSSGTADPVSPLKSGEAPYYKTGQTMGIPGGDTINRWGDYSATIVDPSDDTSFWTLQEYAHFPVAGISQWGTWWGKFHPSVVLPAPTGLTLAADNPTQVTLHWTDQATNESGFVVERKVGAAGTFLVLTSPPLPPNSVTYTDNEGLVAGTTYFYRVGAVGPAGTSYSMEASVTTPGSPLTSGAGGGGGCLSITRTVDGRSSGTSLLSVGILLLPAGALGLRRFFRRKKKSVPIRHPIC